MSGQGDLFGGPVPGHCRSGWRPGELARRLDPDTSKVAAHSSEGLTARHEAAILDALRRIGSGTKDEIAAASGLDAVAVARRMRKMADSGAVAESGRTRATPSGRPATVWRLG